MKFFERLYYYRIFKKILMKKPLTIKEKIYAYNHYSLKNLIIETDYSSEPSR